MNVIRGFPEYDTRLSSILASCPEGIQPGGINRTPYGRWEGTIYNAYEGALESAMSGDGL
jgi:hypothetical protein